MKMLNLEQGPGPAKTIVVVFATEEARIAAQMVLLNAIQHDVMVVVPAEWLPEQWLKKVTRYYRSWTAHYICPSFPRSSVGMRARVCAPDKPRRALACREAAKHDEGLGNEDRSGLRSRERAPTAPLASGLFS